MDTKTEIDQSSERIVEEIIKMLQGALFSETLRVLGVIVELANSPDAHGLMDSPPSDFEISNSLKGGI